MRIARVSTEPNAIYEVYYRRMNGIAPVEHQWCYLPHTEFESENDLYLHVQHAQETENGNDLGKLYKFSIRKIVHTVTDIEVRDAE